MTEEKKVQEILKIPAYRVDTEPVKKAIEYLNDTESADPSIGYSLRMIEMYTSTAKRTAAELGISVQEFDRLYGACQRAVERMQIPNNRTLTLGAGRHSQTFVLPSGCIEAGQTVEEWINTPYPFYGYHWAPKNYRVPFDVFSWAITRFEDVLRNLGWFHGLDVEEGFEAWSQIFELQDLVNPPTRRQSQNNGPAKTTLFNAFVHKRLTHYLLSRFETQIRLVLRMGERGYDYKRIREIRKTAGYNRSEERREMEHALESCQKYEAFLGSMFRREMTVRDLLVVDIPLSSGPLTAVPVDTSVEPTVETSKSKETIMTATETLNIDFNDLNVVVDLKRQLDTLLLLKKQDGSINRVFIANPGHQREDREVQYSAFPNGSTYDELMDELDKTYRIFLTGKISEVVQQMQNLGVKFSEDQIKDMIG